MKRLMVWVIAFMFLFATSAIAGEPKKDAKPDAAKVEKTEKAPKKDAKPPAAKVEKAEKAAKKDAKPPAGKAEKKEKKDEPKK